MKLVKLLLALVILSSCSTKTTPLDEVQKFIQLEELEIYYLPLQAMK
jgi:hypothetical protein